MTHVQRIKPRIQRSAVLRRLLNNIKSRAPRRCPVKKWIEKKPRMTAHYGTSRPEPRGYSRRNHALLRRLQSRKFLLPSGELRSTLRQALASQGIHQMSRLAAKWQELEQRMRQSVLPLWESNQFKPVFHAWYQAGCPETRENYFWRIKYCGLIELGIEVHHWNRIKRLHEQRHKRGLKNALYPE